MKNFPAVYTFFIALMITLTSCELAKGIFKAGFISAFIVIFLVVGVIVWLFTRGGSKT